MESESEKFYRTGEWKTWLQHATRVKLEASTILHSADLLFPSVEDNDALVNNPVFVRNYYITMSVLLEIIGFTCKSPFTAVYECRAPSNEDPDANFWRRTFPAFEKGTASHCWEFELLSRIMENFADLGFGVHTVHLFNVIVTLYQNSLMSPSVQGYYVGAFRPRSLGLLPRLYGDDFTLLPCNPFINFETYHPKLSEEIQAIVHPAFGVYKEKDKSQPWPFCKHGIYMRLVTDGVTKALTFKCHLHTQPVSNCGAIQVKV